jgi:hypothetical protein
MLSLYPERSEILGSADHWAADIGNGTITSKISGSPGILTLRIGQ